MYPKSTFPKHRFGTDFGKPKFPPVPKSAADTNLSHFIGEDSWFFFAAFGQLENGMLQMPVPEWEEQDTYKLMKSYLATFVVTNDSAERGVKLTMDKLGSATIEERYQNITSSREGQSNGT